jgi:hypothetical protein
MVVLLDKRAESLDDVLLPEVVPLRLGVLWILRIGLVRGGEHIPFFSQHCTIFKSMDSRMRLDGLSSFFFIISFSSSFKKQRSAQIKNTII